MCSAGAGGGCDLEPLLCDLGQTQTLPERRPNESTAVRFVFGRKAFAAVARRRQHVLTIDGQKRPTCFRTWSSVVDHALVGSPARVVECSPETPVLGQCSQHASPRVTFALGRCADGSDWTSHRKRSSVLSDIENVSPQAEQHEDDGCLSKGTVVESCHRQRVDENGARG